AVIDGAGVATQRRRSISAGRIPGRRAATAVRALGADACDTRIAIGIERRTNRAGRVSATAGWAGQWIGGTRAGDGQVVHQRFEITLVARGATEGLGLEGIFTRLTLSKASLQLGIRLRQTFGVDHGALLLPLGVTLQQRGRVAIDTSDLARDAF